MRTLRITKGTESYALTFGDDDPEYDRQRKDLLLRGWAVEIEDADADADLLRDADAITKRVHEALATEAQRLADLDAAIDTLRAMEERYAALAGSRRTNGIAARMRRARIAAEEARELI